MKSNDKGLVSLHISGCGSAFPEVYIILSVFCSLSHGIDEFETSYALGGLVYSCSKSLLLGNIS